MSEAVKQWSSIKLTKDPILLLGNGASRAIDNAAFDYPTLLSRAKLSDPSQRVFKLIGQCDFEKALHRLEITKETNRTIKLPDNLTENYIDEIRAGLVRAVRSIHPTKDVSLSENSASNAINFISNFRAVFTLNYDFFLYWLINKANNSDNQTRYFKDGFWVKGKFCFDKPELFEKPKNGLPSTVCYFLHGALHLIDDPEQKLTLDAHDEHLKVRLTDKIKAAWEHGKRPLFVSEGSSDLKFKRIESSVYLRHAFEEFKRLLRQHDIVIYGASLSEQDQHLVDAINESKPKRVLVSLHNPSETDDPRLADWSDKIKSAPVEFFDASSEGSWIY